MTPKRFDKIRNVIGRRQKFLTIVLENIHDPHNVSAILRTADAVGIDKVYLIYNSNKFPRIGKTSSASAKKWIELERFESVKECFSKLRESRYRIYSSHVSDCGGSLSLYDLNLTVRTALVFGNEHEGVSEDARKLSDRNFMIPMYGMVQSLNVSVAAAVCLYETLRQRELKSMYSKSAYTQKELRLKFAEYSLK